MATWIVAAACSGAHGDRGIRTRRLDRLPGAVIGRIGAIEDGQYTLGAVGSEVNGLNLGQRAYLQSHLAVKTAAWEMPLAFEYLA